ncbi:MAG: TIGR02099 family protein [Azoarcus sp.]|jgi:uncharacterized protein (TIGR02099 family)|nr:TIGR02099 family protein [Azoarcus sp.]
MNAVVPPLAEKPARARKPGSRHLARRLRGWGIGFLLLAAFVCGAAFAVSRVWLFPWLGEHREWVAAELSRASGVPVSIDSLAVDWAGPRPRLRLGGLTMHAGERAVLRLERVEATVAWRSLLWWMPYFHSLEIVAPSVELGRDKDGVFTVAGIRIMPRGDGGAPLAWLFEQYSVVVRDAAVVWNDELRGAPPLRLDDAQFVFNRGLVRHRFELKARPPAGLARALDMSGDVSQYGSGALTEISGRLQVSVEGADLGGWQPWVDYPFPVKGRGSVRLWLDSDGGGTVDASADLSLNNVETTLAADLPPLRLSRLGGRLQWHRMPDGIGFGARSLWLDAGGGKALDPMDFDVRLRHGENAAVIGGAFSASSLDLTALATLAGYLPLGKDVRAYLTEFAPRGHVRELALDWEGDAAAPRGWSLKANVENIGLAARGIVPGMNGISGWIEGDEKSGRFNIIGRDAWLDLPKVFENSHVAFASLEAKGGWRRGDERLAIVLDKVGFANADAEGTVSGRYWPASDGPGELDLTGNLTRAEGGAVWRYIPLVAGQNAYNWVKNGILQAKVTSARLELKGPMRDFPFRNGRGKFLVQIEANNGRLDYAAGWPVAEDIEASLRFEGPGVTIDARQGRIFGARLEPVRVRIADFSLGVVSVKGIAKGPSADFMRYVAKSPLSARLQGFPGPLRAEGNGHLNLDLTIPVRDLATTKVVGDYRFTGNRIHLGDGGLVLESAEGGLNFTAETLSIPAIRGRLLGGPFLLEGKTGATGLALHAQGRAEATAARKSMGWPLLGWLGGTADWRAEFNLGKDGHRLAVQSNLKGLHSRLPAPFAKEADSLLPLEIEAVSPGGDKPRLLTAKLGYWLNVLLVQDADGVLRGGVGLNQPSMLPKTAGVDVAASLDVLDVDAWQWSLGENGGNLDLPLTNVSLDARRMRAFGRAFSDLKLRVKFDGGGWRADIESVEAQGRIDWRRDGDGMLKARLRRLVLTDDAGGSDNNAPPRHLPGLDVRAERFAVSGRELGQLEVLASNQDGGWRLDSFAVYRPETQLIGSGVWRPVERQSKFDFTLTTSDTGTFAGAMGYSNIVRGGKAKLAGQLAWHGAPTGIDYPTLSGRLELNVENGRFERLEPGVGRLLGILSLQALPRRVTLDFRDVFSDGFVFSNIAGKIAVSNGVMRTDNIEIAGPAARVLMKGQADITAETQDLRVTVRPTLTESVAIGAAVVNPAAGAVAYLAQKVLGDPIEKMFSYDYEVTGNWVEPVVTKIRAQADKRAEVGNTETLHAVH